MTATPNIPLDSGAPKTYAAYAVRDAERLADYLVEIADRLRQLAPALGRGDGTAVAQAAEMINDYTQGVGQAGGRMWNLLHDAETADRIARQYAAQVAIVEVAAASRAVPPVPTTRMIDGQPFTEYPTVPVPSDNRG